MSCPVRTSPASPRRVLTVRLIRVNLSHMNRFCTTCCMMIFFAVNAVLAGMSYCFCVVKTECGCDQHAAESCADHTHEHCPTLTANNACDHAVIPGMTLPDRWDDGTSIPFFSGTPLDNPFFTAPFSLKSLLAASGALRAQAPPLIARRTADQLGFGAIIACRC